MAKSLFQGSGPNVQVDPQDLAYFLQQNKDIRDLLMSQAGIVKGEAEGTAQDAQGGPGGKLDGYAEAGFSVKWDGRSRRPRVLITSDADPDMALRVHLSTQKRWGIAHLRKALKAIT